MLTAAYIIQQNTLYMDLFIICNILRILNSLGRFQDEVLIPTNTTKVYTQMTFALQVQDVSTESFSGETLNVDLGSFEEALSLNTSIPEQALQTTMEALSDATASITIPPNILTAVQGGEKRLQRLSYGVFLKDILFQSPNQTANNLSIETIIIALRLPNITVDQTLSVPLHTAFGISRVSVRYFLLNTQIYTYTLTF